MRETLAMEVRGIFRDMCNAARGHEFASYGLSLCLLGHSLDSVRKTLLLWDSALYPASNFCSASSA